MKSKIVIGIVSLLVIVSVVGNIYLYKNNNELHNFADSSTKEIESLNNTITEKESELQTIQSNNAELEKKIPDLQTQIDELQTELEKATANPYNIVPITLVKYTNADADVYSIPDESGDLIDTVSINTEVLKTGETNDETWSRVEYNGLSAYIKSSLLSKTKTEVKTPSDTSNGGTQSQPSNPAPSGGGKGTVAGGDPFGDSPQHSGGSGGYNGGTTGHVSEGGYGGAY